MKTLIKSILLLSIILLFFSRCGKEEYVPIYAPGSMEYGWATAKKNGRDFTASATGVILRTGDEADGLWYLIFRTFTDYGAERESIQIGVFQTSPGQYRVTSERYDFDAPDIVRAGYGTSQDDGDVAEDSYEYDMSYHGKVVVEAIDTVAWTAQGTFDLRFKFRNVRPKRNPLNPDIVHFRNGKFEVQIIEY